MEPHAQKRLRRMEPEFAMDALMIAFERCSRQIACRTRAPCARRRGVRQRPLRDHHDRRRVHHPRVLDDGHQRRPRGAHGRDRVRRPSGIPWTRKCSSISERAGICSRPDVLWCGYWKTICGSWWARRAGSVISTSCNPPSTMAAATSVVAGGGVPTDVRGRKGCADRSGRLLPARAHAATDHPLVPRRHGPAFGVDPRRGRYRRGVGWPTV